jgi:Uma2 family endonuclease
MMKQGDFFRRWSNDTGTRNFLSPHIDVLVYVVSPERYRDNKAWQLLLAEGGKHAWIFVLNQSDRGHNKFDKR